MTEDPPHGNGADDTFIIIAPSSRRVEAAAELDAGALGKDGQPFDATADAAQQAGKGNGSGKAFPYQSDPVMPIDWVVAALERITHDDRSWPYWNTVAMAVWAARHGDEEGYDAFNEWSQRYDGYNEEHTYKRWTAITGTPPDQITYRKLGYLAGLMEESPDDDGEAPFEFGLEAAAKAKAPPDVKPTPPGEDEPAADDLVVYDLKDDWRTPVPPRRWLSAFSFCRKLLSLLSGQSGAGKSAVRILQLLALATGNGELIGEYVWRPCRILFVSFEEDLEEIRRRIGTAIQFYRIDPETIEGAFLYLSLGEQADGEKLMELDPLGRVREGKLMAKFRKMLRKHRPDVVSLDPFIDTHAVPENDNTQQNIVVKRYVRIAREMQLAFDLTDHDRKGGSEPGDQERNRGASSKIAAVRLGYGLTVMTKEEAQRFGIGEDDRRRFVRYDSIKLNPAPPQKARWFELIEVRFTNGDEEFPGGDGVQVAKLWVPPEPLDGVEPDALAALVAELGAGLPDGQRYSDASRATDLAAWRVVQLHYPDKTEAQCRNMVRELVIKGGRLFAYDYHNPVKRKLHKGLHSNPRESNVRD